MRGSFVSFLTVGGRDCFLCSAAPPRPRASGLQFGTGLGLLLRLLDVSLDQRGDIYIDAADTTAAQVWLDPVKAQEWVLAQLKAQGVTMRAA
jgi:hypothetical protein